MYVVVITKGGTEFSIAALLRAENYEVFLPFTRAKVSILTKSASTRATPRPRAIYKSVLVDTPLWPRYLFCRDSTTPKVKGVYGVIKNGEGEPIVLTNTKLDELRQGCTPEGLVIEKHNFAVGDMLRFVAGSSLTGHTAKALSIADNGDMHVLVDNRVKATVNYNELTNA